MCKDNEQTYTLQGCAPLECAPMPKCNQTGYTLSLGHRSIRVLYVWLGGIQHVVFFSDGSFKKAHEMRCLACNKLVKLNKNYHFVVKMDAFNEPLYFLPMSFFFCVVLFRSSLFGSISSNKKQIHQLHLESGLQGWKIPCKSWSSMWK